jgi:YD repeat-containing protein
VAALASTGPVAYAYDAAGQLVGVSQEQAGAARYDTTPTGI